MTAAIRAELRVYDVGNQGRQVLVETLYDAHGAIVDQNVKTRSNGNASRWSTPHPLVRYEQVYYGLQTRETCHRCGGEGAVDSSNDVGPSGMVTCPICFGSGDRL